MKKTIAILILSSFLLNSCGVIFGGSKFSATIKAKDHPNANIYVNGNKVGQGTASILHPRNAPLTVELKQDGCENKSETFNKTFRTGNFILTILGWGLIGVAVDLGTGASYKPDHKSNPAIQRLSDKNYSFNVEYTGCK
ncbi:MAG: hypothetical protein IM631_19180 [Cytophagales bacterium]|nr:hypothetical protein [Cytophagales bacterium]MCA6373497.1 hypothetical protein [Cytophagales bacterium]MCA6385348.1 hypothetical protein [Cytophagales bacterium]